MSIIITTTTLPGADLEKFLHLMPEETYNDRELEKAFTELARPMYKDKVPLCSNTETPTLK